MYLYSGILFLLVVGTIYNLVEIYKINRNTKRLQSRLGL
jgi:hypothetical protein